MKFQIDNIQFIPVKPHSGLVGFASCEIDGSHYIGSLGVYTNLEKPGSYRLTFPCKKLANGQLVKLYSPISVELAQAITNAVSEKVSSLLGSETGGGENL